MTVSPFGKGGGILQQNIWQQQFILLHCCIVVKGKKACRERQYLLLDHLLLFLPHPFKSSLFYGLRVTQAEKRALL